MGRRSRLGRGGESSPVRPYSPKGGMREENPRIPEGGWQKRKPNKRPMPHCREKPLGSRAATVPQTDTGRRGENPQALERTLVKEFGKLIP